MFYNFIYKDQLKSIDDKDLQRNPLDCELNIINHLNIRKFMKSLVTSAIWFFRNKKQPNLLFIYFYIYLFSFQVCLVLIWTSLIKNDPLVLKKKSTLYYPLYCASSFFWPAEEMALLNLKFGKTLVSWFYRKKIQIIASMYLRRRKLDIGFYFSKVLLWALNPYLAHSDSLGSWFKKKKSSIYN